MNIIVQKFGGTSVGDVERIKKVASLVIAEKKLGNHPVVVVSAMAGTTDHLVNLSNDFEGQTHSLEEYDSLLAAGEQISSSLLAMALNQLGYKARSWLGWQLPIISDNNHSKTRVLNVNVDKIHNALANDEIPIIAGFQSLTDDNRIGTLGRGGSDTTAAAVSAAINAQRCDIYTDVCGIYTADPRIVKDARMLDNVSYQEMLELSSLGAKVLHARSIEIAMKYKIPLRVLSTFEPGAGTILITDEHPLEGRFITAITYSTAEVKIDVKSVPINIGIAGICELLSRNDIKLDMITQNTNVDGSTNLSFTVKKQDCIKVLNILKEYEVEHNMAIAKVSLVGVGIRSNTAVAKDIFKCLALKNIPISLVSTSETKITVLIPDDYTELAVRALHTTFELDR